MAQINKPVAGKYKSQRTYEGGAASHISDVEKLKRSIMATMLWEDNFYEDGEAIADRIVRLTKSVKPQKAIEIMLEAKQKQKLRHAPLLMAIALVESGALKKENIPLIVDRADLLTEFLAMYWKDGKKPIDHQVRKGLALAFKKFDEYQLAKYDRKKEVRLRDVIRMVRPRPDTREQSELWHKLVTGKLKTPDTWEVALSSGADKKETFTRLIMENNLGDLAFIRNLRNMVESGVDIEIIRKSFSERKWGRILPFQFIAAAKHAPILEPEIEKAMLSALSGMEMIPGKVILLVDGSWSMSGAISGKSEMQRFDAACGLAILARELCDDIRIYRFDYDVGLVPARHGFALRDALGSPDGGTRMWKAIETVSEEHSRLIIVITDEQTSDNDTLEIFNTDLLAIINVAPYENGVSYGGSKKKSIHINGWSENVLTYLRKYLSDFISAERQPEGE